jgi:uncharacterized protein YdaU (DUF1376 family)
MYYYQHHIGDYLKHTAHLTPLEDIAYRRLLDVYYDTESPIPTDIPLVSRRLRIDPATVKLVLDEFFQSTEQGYRNKRADLEIAAYHAFLEKQKANGIKGGRPKTQTTDNPPLSQAEPKITLTTNREPLTENQEPTTSNNKERSPNGSRLTIEKLPKEYFDFCKSERPEIDPERTWQGFRDYWIAKAGKDGRKADWLATWRRWVRNQKVQNNGSGNGKFNAYAYTSEVLARELASQAVGNGFAQEIFDVVPTEIFKLLPESGGS